MKSIKKKYKEKLLVSEEQWPPVRGDKLINLQLVEADKSEGFHGSLPQHETGGDKIKRTPILYDDIFRVEKGKKPVRKVLVEGNGGIGKTTLCTMLSEGWGKEKLLTQFDCVLLLPLREKLVASAESLPDLIKLLHSSECVRTSVINELEESEGEKVLIIADGWDELEVAKRSKGSFLYKLLLGSVLPFASVLLTSRPSASAPLHSLPSVDRMVEVVGFNEEKIKQYIESEFEKNPEKAIGLIKQLEKNQILLSICTIPLNCAITCNLWHTQYQELPSTLTELYTQIILNVILRDIKKKFPDSPIGLSLSDFDSIPSQLEPYWWLTCKFAFEALSNDQLVFTEEEVTTFFPEGLVSNQLFLCFGLLQSANSLLPVGQGISFHFLHLTFQEYLAALHLVTLSPEEQLKVIRTHARSNRFAMVWRFFFGVGSKKRGSFCRRVSKKAVSVDSVMVEEFLSILGNSRERQRFFGNSKLRQFFSHFPKRYLNSGNHLLLCQCAFESKDDNLSDKIANDIDGVFLRMYSANKIFDCAAVFHVLSYTARCSRTCVDLNGWDLGDKELTGLTEILSHSHEKQLQMSSLDLGHNRFTNNAVSDLFNKASAAFCSLEVINLEHTNIDGDCVSNILATLEHFSCKSLVKLVLSNNHLGVCGVQALERAMLAGVFINLEDLQLVNTLTDDADINSALLTTLMRAIASHCHQVDSLRLSSNVVGIADGSALGEALLLVTNERENFQLDLGNTNLCARAITAYINSILSSSERYNVRFQNVLPHWDCKYNTSKAIPRHGLGLNCNALGYDGLLAVFRLLRSNPFQVSGLYIADVGLPSLADAKCPDDINSNTITGELLCMEPFPQNDSVELLLIDSNDFSGKNRHLLVGLLRVCQSLMYLYSDDCHLTSEDLVQILTQLKSTRSSGITACMKLKSWSLSNNNIDDVGIASLIECLSDLFPSLGDISLNGNPVSKEMEKRLKECLEINRKVSGNFRKPFTVLGMNYSLFA